jgi:hypothetical protein
MNISIVFEKSYRLYEIINYLSKWFHISGLNEKPNMLALSLGVALFEHLQKNGSSKGLAFTGNTK